MKVKIAEGEGVFLYAKSLKNNRKSLFLQYRDAKGKSHVKYLQLYLESERVQGARMKNKNTMRTAEEYRVQFAERRHVAAGAADENETDDLFSIIVSRAKKQKSPKGYLNLLRHLKLYTGKSRVEFSAITLPFVRGFLEYLRTDSGLKTNTTHTYYTVFTTILNHLVNQYLIRMNPCRLLDKRSEIPKVRVTDKGFLTYDELRRLYSTPCKDDVVKRAFLFACAIGIRISDARALRWNNIIEDVHSRTLLSYTTQKTGYRVTIPLPGHLLNLFDPHPHLPDDQIFPLATDWNVNKKLKRWAKDAGITKNIHFHLARHTAATMMLSEGNDLWTVAKVVGLESTRQLERTYAKVTDETKRKAMVSLPDYTGLLPQVHGT